MNIYLWNKLPTVIQEAMQDDSITEIMLNPDGKLWLAHRTKGIIHRCEVNVNHALNLISILAQDNGQYINANKPYLDCILPFDNARFNATIPPITEGPSFNIRKHSKHVITLDTYCEQDIITKSQNTLLKQAISTHQNILVSGGPGSGKTTLTNAMLDYMAVVAPQGTRTLLLEQVRELQCHVPNCKRMVTTDNVDLRTLLWIAMRNSPDRIIIGEVRDGAALDMLKAWNTGCPGGIATIHANSPEAALQRVIDLSLEVTTTTPFGLIAEAIDVVVQIARDSSHPHGRRVTDLMRVQGFDRANQSFLLTNMESC